MAEPIQMPFGLWAWMGLRDYVVDGGSDPPWEGAVLKGKGQPIVSIGMLCCKKGKGFPILDTERWARS